MMVFLKREGEEVWDEMEIDLYIPVNIVDGKEVLTQKVEWTAHDKEMVKYNN